MQHVKGYIYSLGGGLLRYEGPVQVLATDTCMHHMFTVVKPMNTATRNVKPWDKYKAGISNPNRHTKCIYFKRGVFKLLKYEQSSTVLYGNPT